MMCGSKPRTECQFRFLRRGRLSLRESISRRSAKRQRKLGLGAPLNHSKGKGIRYANEAIFRKVGKKK